MRQKMCRHALLRADMEQLEVHIVTVQSFGEKKRLFHRRLRARLMIHRNENLRSVTAPLAAEIKPLPCVGRNNVIARERRANGSVTALCNQRSSPSR